MFTPNGGHWLIALLRKVVLALTEVPVEGVKSQFWAGTTKGVTSREYYEPIGVRAREALMRIIMT
jgi:hypothetical protein